MPRQPGNANCTGGFTGEADTQITFVSSLTPEDEARLAGALLDALAGLLDLLPIAYSVRVETALGTRLDRASPPLEASVERPPSGEAPSLLRVVGPQRRRPVLTLSDAQVR